LDTLRAISNQEIDIPYEVIIVENSPLRSARIQEFIKVFKDVKFVNFELHGATNARHYGYNISQGDILVFIDDDIEMGPDWLRELTTPLVNARADQVAGRILLKFEVPLPEHLKQYKNFYSELDLSESSFYFKPYEGCAVSANMAITRHAFEEANGLNVCYYGREEMLHYSGDGECGLSRKLFDLNKKVFYCADAVVHHRIPISRCNEEYLLRRAKNSAIENVYRLYRYSRLRNISLILNFMATSLKFFLFIIKDQSNFQNKFKLRIYESQMRQILEVARSSELRRYILRKNYMLKK
jgi:glycosyltransferase involved in cell wall biosynthesis